MFARTLKTVAVAAAVVVATASASMAATYAWVDSTAKVKATHSNSSPTVNWVHEGQKVKIVSSWGNWYKVQIPGKDGWVRAHNLDFAPSYPGPFPGYGYGYGGGYGGGASFCVGGNNASFCLSGGY
jgi:hypothetical protein